MDENLVADLLGALHPRLRTAERASGVHAGSSLRGTYMANVLESQPCVCRFGEVLGARRQAGDSR
jgi:hypothetical protein